MSREPSSLKDPVIIDQCSETDALPHTLGMLLPFTIKSSQSTWHCT